MNVPYGSEVCILTFNDSIGHNKISAINYAAAEDIRNPVVLYFFAFY